jgi:nucleotide-binding universal stress UspA family protein
MANRRGVPRIMAAMDLGDGSTLAVDQANHRAVALDGRLAICVAVPPLEPETPLARQGVARELGPIREAVARRAVARVQALTGRSASDFEMILAEGPAHAAIVHCAETWAADLLVLGSQGESGFGRAWLGSVAERVVRHAHCPVLVCRSSHHGRHIVAGTDFSDPSLPALEAGAAEARLSGARLVALHSLETRLTRYEMSGSFGGFMKPSETSRDLFEAADRRLATALSSRGISAERRIAMGPAAAELVRLADKLDAELVVVGTRGRTGLARVLLGSVAEEVVRVASCSVLVVRLQPAGN